MRGFAPPRNETITVPVVHRTEARAHLVIRLFGSMEVIRDGVPLTGKMSLYARWLLALLVWQREKVRTRSWLAETLWQEYALEDEEKRSANFRQQLRSLRHALRDEASRLLEIEEMGPPGLKFDLTGSYVDVIVFERAYQRVITGHGGLSLLEEAVDLYRGDLLEACKLPWAEDPRRMLKDKYLDALERFSCW